MSKITISVQYLTGNEVEGLNRDKYLSRLRDELIAAAEKHVFEGDDVDVQIDIQNASGYSRSTAVYVDDDEDGDIDVPALENAISAAERCLWDAVGSDPEFYE